MPEQKDVDIKEVARIAGVSIATVSRVVNSFKGVREGTRLKVELAIQQSGYRPNLVARALQRRKTSVVGCVLPYVHDYFAARVDGASIPLQEAGFSSLLFTTRRSPQGALAALRLLQEERVAGAMISLHTMGGAVREAVRECASRFPVVLFDHNLGVPGVVELHYDDFAAGELAARTLLNRGRKQIVCLRGPEGHGPAESRYAGWKAALQAAGCFTEELVVSAGFSFRSGERALDSLLEIGVELDGVIAVNDDSAIGALAALRKRGVAVPERVSVIGCDDALTAPYSVPSLTTIRQDQALLGRMAGESLLGSPPETLPGAGELVVRESV